ncbi:MAG: HAD family phosphatase [Candidatus Poribacteria bacterium]|jgi:HAD superfamily hydrolase (TIGR01509 family)|nr:HAD family phosphatase [Candidatus Poribacteria bacterium]MDP6746988.1 HAD family phosphatase [Candidatus Poribacteria bacterium]MDP6997182.1 HAD family phosphatase [Candidatus Poribacteria bacterium]
MKMELEKFDAIIFDMDGTLLDTERLSYLAFLEACREHEFENMEKAEAVYRQCIGCNSTKLKQILREGFGKTLPPEFYERWRRIYSRDAYEKAPPVKPGARELLSFLESRNMVMAVATSTKYINAIKKLKSTQLDHYFQTVVGGDQVEKSKPDPEIFQLTISSLQAHPSRCLALEDSNNGTLAAHSAGMFVYQIPDMLPPSEEVKTLVGNRLRIFTSLSAVLEKLKLQS